MADHEPKVRTELIDGVAVLTLDHQPSRNGLGPKMRDHLMAAFDRAVRSTGVRAIVVTGAHEDFCAGSDIGAILGQDLDDRVERLRDFQTFLAGWGVARVPVLVAVEGAAAGGGVSMALAADWVVAASDAFFVSGWVSLGVVPDAGAMWFLVRALGQKRATDWMWSTSPLSASEAVEFGIVTTVCSPGEARASAVARARELAELPEAALGASKRLLRLAANSSLEDLTVAELYAQAHLFQSDEHRAAVERFLRHRTPREAGDD